MQSSREQQGKIKKEKKKKEKNLLSDQCKEIGENNRMGKTRDLFNKTGDTKEIFIQIQAQ